MNISVMEKPINEKSGFIWLLHQALELMYDLFDPKFL